MDVNDRLPPKPIEPSESECCGTGCNPCVFDIYKKQLKKWEEECERIIKNEQPTNINNHNSTLHRLNPENYEKFKLLAIIPDAESSYVYRFNCNPVGSSVMGAANTFCVGIGQHILIKIGSIARQYTVLRLSKDNSGSSGHECFDILIKIYSNGTLTPLISKLQVNDEVLMRGPFGKPINLKPNMYKNIVMLAAGTGIAPFYRIIETVLNNEDDYTRITLIYSNKSVKHVLLKPDINRWSSFWNFRAIHFLTRNGAEPLPYGMEVKLNRLTFVQLAELCINLEQCFYYICGTRSFEKDVVNYLRRMKVSDDRYHVFGINV